MFRCAPVGRSHVFVRTCMRAIVLRTSFEQQISIQSISYLFNFDLVVFSLFARLSFWRSMSACTSFRRASHHQREEDHDQDQFVEELVQDTGLK